MPEAKITKGKPEKPKSSEDQIIELQKAYHATFSSTQGKRVLSDLEVRNWMKSPTISPELHFMAYREGQRSVLLYIKTMMEVDTKRLREMIEEMEKGQDMEPEL
jgi:hypothetical protein